MIQQSWSDVAGKAVDAAKAAGSQIAEALKGAVPQVWDVIVRQTKIDGAEYVAIACVLLAASVLVSLRARKPRASDDPKSDAFPLTGFLHLVSGVLIFISLFFLVNGLDLVLNPAYWSARRILCDTVGKACSGSGF